MAQMDGQNAYRYRVAQDSPNALAGAQLVLPRADCAKGTEYRDDRIDVSWRGPA